MSIHEPLELDDVHDMRLIYKRRGLRGVTHSSVMSLFETVDVLNDALAEARGALYSAVGCADLPDDVRRELREAIDNTSYDALGMGHEDTDAE